MRKILNRQTTRTPVMYPERIVQFGGGNFLRAFVDWVIEDLNAHADFASSVVIVKPTPHGSYDQLEAQDGLFHVHLRGIRAGEVTTELRLVTCVNRVINPYQRYQDFLALACQPEVRFIFSNTTESGIAFEAQDKPDDEPPTSFPGKLTAFLYHRYQHFQGDKNRGCIILPCELIERNGETLKHILLQYADLWELESGFKVWLEADNSFCNTLVDRIVTGYPPDETILDEIGYDDRMLVQGEIYHSWVIQASDALQHEFPTAKTDLNIKFVDDLQPYRETKVRVLNGAHTAMVPVGYLFGLETVREVMEQPETAAFIQDLIYQEILPTLDLPSDELNRFAQDVLDRFRNPYLHHRLLSIALNSISKFKVRLLPSLEAYIQRQHELPQRIGVAFAALIRFYKGEWRGENIPLNDDPVVTAAMRQAWQHESYGACVTEILKNEVLWEQDLTQLDGLVEQISMYLEQIEIQGIHYHR